MNGQWTTERQLFENGQLTNQITQKNMAIQMNECGAEGSFGEGGKIFQASFAGRVANNLVGKWSLGGEEGTFNIQLQNNEKDCASFDGMMYSGDKKWKWTGHKEAVIAPRSCDAECKERDPHLNWNGNTSQYPYCNCVCEAGWEFDTSGKSCVPAGTSDINPCEAECKARAPAGQLSHMVWNGNTSQYPYCNCICDSGYEFDVAGKYCVPIQASNANLSDSTPSVPSVPSGSSSASGSKGNAQLQAITPQGITIELGIANKFFLSDDNPWVDIEMIAKCNDIEKRIKFCKFLYDSGKKYGFSNPDEAGFILKATTSLEEIYKKYCSPLKASGLASNFDVASYSTTEGLPVEITIGLQKGPIRAEVVEDQVALNIETPTVVVSSQGKNTFGVAYDPTSGISYVAAYQYPIQVQPTDGSRAPFILESGQKVEVGNGQIALASPSSQTPGGDTGPNQNPGFVPKGSEGGCYSDPLTGEIVCVDSSGKPSNQQGTQAGGIQGEGAQSEGTQGLCFEDPDTHEIICTDSSGEPSNTQGGMQGGCYQDPATGQYICVD